MLIVLIGLMALCSLGGVIMLWYINENLARIVNELSWIGKYIEKGDRDQA
ncbi:MAG: hypothetical protein ABSF59_22055 [Candidatus Sulfotelmatobacter sp.]|jgi:hypothetical protein